MLSQRLRSSSLTVELGQSVDFHILLSPPRWSKPGNISHGAGKPAFLRLVFLRNAAVWPRSGLMSFSACLVNLDVQDLYIRIMPVASRNSEADLPIRKADGPT